MKVTVYNDVMKTLLVALNASYSHTCLAVRSIASYCKNESVSIAEFTINQPAGEILRGIVQKKPDVVMFSTYIWNAEFTSKIIPDVKKLLPKCILGAGGPEFCYAVEKYFNLLPELDFIVNGEGEETVAELLDALKDNEDARNSAGMHEVFKKVKGIFYRECGITVFSGERELICDLSKLQFAYPQLLSKNLTDEQLNHKIYYYESSRGCPYSCSYCLSSVDKRVRFMPLERVFSDLQIFLDAGVGLVKFVDRTYNLNPERYIAIWKYIVEHHNKKTMFHFEIEAEYLSEEALEFLQNVPSGVMQFEMGVQSANKKTLECVNRSPNVEKLAQNIKRIPRTIHQHLDLIAGLPYENLESFGKSFDFVMSLEPDALQLGFLKVLHGTQMEKYAIENGWKWSKNPVYETFSTPYMSYDDMLFLKDIEVAVDAFWNSGVFSHTMKFIGRTFGFWKFFCKIVEFGRQKETFSVARRETYWFELLFEFGALRGELPLEGVAEKTAAERGLCSEGNAFPTQISDFELVLRNLIKYDFVLRGKQGNWPVWYEHKYNKERHRELLEMNGGVKNARLDFAHSEYELFECNVDSDFPEKNIVKYEKLVKYSR